MKKIFYMIIGALGIVASASAQTVPLMPNVNIGIKGGVNLSAFSTEKTLSADNRAGYLAGIWGRIGIGGLHFQPELYYTSKNVKFYDSGARAENTAKFRSIDLPLLIGKRFGLMGVGTRFNTGPLVSFAVSHDQSVGDAFSNASRLRVKDQNYAWQFGAGLDVSRLSLDLRYELGLNKVKNGEGNADVRLNMFNFTVGYRLFAM
ncbi:porin family protein [Mucilaginibacter aquatilis]|uniref:Outer membrane beta-barrel protein n=1 Tax=Mucilaginibacter aquatilis TaxID=1517760 RepID=A0A6I4IQR2_9SPHI|nr:porin family protein [Mucilaginibacter aquatilis]MVN91584.1 outer membrane beta-barrel protein [Mucilaginibacter aquatilis]